MKPGSATLMAGPDSITPEKCACLRLRASTYQMPGSAVVVAAGLIVAADALIPESGRPIWRLGSLDELAHLATGVVVLGALGPTVDGPLARGLIGASVLIDLDHIPQYAGRDWLTARTDRPYPHSLLTPIAAAGFLSVLRRRAPRGDVTRTALGALIGLGAHLLRDLADPNTGVPLLWPIANRAFSIPRNQYLALLGAGLARCLARRLTPRDYLTKVRGCPRMRWSTRSAASTVWSRSASER